jgi:hypothetical protein
MCSGELGDITALFGIYAIDGEPFCGHRRLFQG